MRGEKKVTIRLRCNHKRYKVFLHSIKYTKSIIFTKLIVGNERFWILKQEGTFRIIPDMAGRSILT